MPYSGAHHSPSVGFWTHLDATHSAHGALGSGWGCHRLLGAGVALPGSGSCFRKEEARDAHVGLTQRRCLSSSCPAPQLTLEMDVEFHM